MNQSRKGSFIEALTNVVIGYTISFMANAVILTHYGFHITTAQNLQIGVWFTVVSLVRSYLIRRYFNSYIQRMAYGKPTS